MTTQYVRAHYCSPKCEKARFVCAMCAAERRERRKKEVAAVPIAQAANAYTVQAPTLRDQPFARLLLKLMGGGEP